MRERATIARAALLAILLTLPAAGARADKQDFSQIERGRYLTIVGDCAACHTLTESGKAFAGGRPIETPFGNLLAPNITPDVETGIGAWSDDEFVNALTKGTGRHGTRLYPAMPYTYMTKTSREDALAIRAYLNTVPAVRNPVRSNQLSFPFNIRLGLAAWDQLYFSPGTFHPDPTKSQEWNRGAYLVEGLMHCGLCHTPKNFAGGDHTGQALQGYALQGWFAPNITSDKRRGIGEWSIDDIVSYLKTGHNQTQAASGPMAEVVMDSSSKLTDADLRAIAVYLKDQPAGGGGEASNAPDQALMKSGEQIFIDECAACHRQNAKGIPGMFPTLAGSPAVQSTDPASLLRVVLRGARSAATDAAPTGPAMPAFGWLLSDQEVAAVITYIRNAWGNSAPAVSAADVAKARDDLSKRSD
ncbi:MAG: c-type cytochrome [Bradyrhizobiaceae bacterium]|nr:c-type cytochrome [Bradyrhizobiaceae bacterium]